MYIFLPFKGTSDPYVKFKVGRKLCYRSKTIKRNLNPRWDEAFSIPIDDPESTVIRVKVFDYDRGLHDDRMGFSVIQTRDLQPNQSVSSCSKPAACYYCIDYTSGDRSSI